MSAARPEYEATPGVEQDNNRKKSERKGWKGDYIFEQVIFLAGSKLVLVNR